MAPAGLLLTMSLLGSITERRQRHNTFPGNLLGRYRVFAGLKLLARRCIFLARLGQRNGLPGQGPESGKQVRQRAD